MYVQVLSCLVAFQPLSSIIPASLQHPCLSSLIPASSQHPHSLFPASSQPQASICFDTHVQWSSMCSCTCVNWQLFMVDMYVYNIYMYIYMCVCIHHQYSLITCMHWSSICMTALSHTCTVFLCVCWLPRSHVGAVSGDKNDAYPGCSAENQKKDISNIHKNTNKTNNTPHGNRTHVLHFQPQCKASLNHQT